MTVPIGTSGAKLSIAAPVHQKATRSFARFLSPGSDRTSAGDLVPAGPLTELARYSVRAAREAATPGRRKQPPSAGAVAAATHEVAESERAAAGAPWSTGRELRAPESVLPPFGRAVPEGNGDAGVWAVVCADTRAWPRDPERDRKDAIRDKVKHPLFEDGHGRRRCRHGLYGSKSCADRTAPACLATGRLPVKDVTCKAAPAADERMSPRRLPLPTPPGAGGMADRF